jgi:DNA-binding GntR family transcriptional regulator
VVLDRGSPVPLYFQVATQLEGMIEAGELPAGDRLANEVDLAQRLGVSRPTMRRAIQYLVERGMLVRKRGVGTQIVHPKVRRPVQLTSLYDDLAKTGRAPKTEVRELIVGPATAAMAKSLGLPEGLPVTWFERLRYADGEPLALLRNAVPLGVLQISRAALETQGLYEMLRAADHVPRTASQIISARSATSTEARQLGESRAAPLLAMNRTAWDERGAVVEYGSHIYRASRYTFELTLTV